MTHPIEKPKRAPLIHHPTAVLDSFCHCDDQDHAWLDFSASLTEQLAQFEAAHSDYIRPRPANNRRSSNR